MGLEECMRECCVNSKATKIAKITTTKQPEKYESGKHTSEEYIS